MKYELAPGRSEKKRDFEFYRALTEDARRLAARLQDEEARSLVVKVSSVFARAAARLEKEEATQLRSPLADPVVS